MADPYIEFRDIIQELVNQGAEESKLLNEIWAMRFNNKKTVSEMRAYLKTFKANEKNILQKPEQKTFQHEVGAFFPHEYRFDDRIPQRTFDVQFKDNNINDLYFLEEEPVIQEKLNSHINFLKTKFSQVHNVEISRLTENSDTEIYVVGRVNIEEKNYVSVVYLEDITGKILINIDKVNSYTIFPGQVIMVKGTSDSLEFLVSEIFTNTYNYIERPSVSFNKLLIGAVAGPFSTRDLDFSRFLTFLADITRRVNVLIIVGPFVDSENEILGTGVFSIKSLSIENGTYESIFTSLNKYIKDCMFNNSCEVIVVPHIKEMCHIFPLPMPSLSRSYNVDTDSSKNFHKSDIKYPSSPSFLNIQGVNVDVVPYDLVGEILTSSISKSDSPNRIMTVLRQIFEQHSYLPIMPNNLPVEYSKFDSFCYETTPHIFITTSKFPIKPDHAPGVTCVRLHPFFEGNSPTSFYTVINITKTPARFSDSVGIKWFKITSD